MQILAISKLKEGVTPDQIGAVGAEEVKHTMEAYLDGKIRNFWFQVNSPGVVFILECKDEDEARQVMNELPLVVAGLMDVDLIPLQPLLPLGTLIGRKFSL
ncbi:MAG: muconolactone delta-isomerase [Acidimicrobiales bacterium]|jgi:muconolactone delta-isomerase